MQIIFKKIKPAAKIPAYQTDGSAGMDVCAVLDAQVVLGPMQRAIIPTGLGLELPKGYEAQVRARSGLAAKHGVSLVNGVGTIDSDYRGEIGVILVNLGQQDFAINSGDRIAQIVIARYVVAQPVVAGELAATPRGALGFGSTGK